MSVVRTPYKWIIAEQDHARARALGHALTLPPIVAHLLLLRGVETPEAAQQFLYPKLEDLTDPYRLTDMDAAVERLLQAGRQGERITIWGDYDVDGVTSVSLLLLFLRRLGFTVDYYIPSRLEEGYGLNSDAVQQVIRQGTQLLVTVDCGISDYRQVEEARQAGVQVLIIDHHQVPEEIPQAVAVLDPHRLDCPFPQKEAAAVGVTFYLLMALRARLNRVRAAFDEVVIATKTMTRTGPGIQKDIARFRKELGTDVLDVVLLHDVRIETWLHDYAGAMDALSQAKAQGTVRAVGLSCHSLGALRAATGTDWADVVLVRINYAGVNMDGTVAEVVPLIEKLHVAGKAVYGMKVLGCGRLTHDVRGAVKYVLGLGTVHTMVVGMTDRAQLDENIRLVNELSPQYPLQGSSH